MIENLPNELIDIICNKINGQILISISLENFNINDKPGKRNNFIYTLNKKRIQKYWDKTTISDIVKTNDLHGIRYLINHRTIDPITPANDAVMYSCEFGNLEMLKYLVLRGALFPQSDGPMTVACVNGHLEIVKYMISIGCDFMRGNCVCIKAASKAGHLPIVEYIFELYLKHIDYPDFVEKKYKFETGDEIYNIVRNCLIWASISGHLSIIKFFIEKYPFFNIETLKNCLLQACDCNHLNIVKYFIHEKNIDLTHTNNQPIILATNNNNLDIVKYLYENGADIHAQNDRLLMIACEKGYLDIVKYLAENGVDITTQNNLALFHANLHNRTDITEYLVSQGATYSQNENVIIEGLD